MIESHQKRESILNSSVDSGIESPLNYSVLCKECSQFLCKVTEIRYREPTYLCYGTSFEEKINIDYGTQKYFCKNSSCQKELGKLLNFAKGKLRLAFILDIKGIKFKSNNEDTATAFKQWSKIPFSVKRFDED